MSGVGISPALALAIAAGFVGLRLVLRRRAWSRRSGQIAAAILVLFLIIQPFVAQIFRVPTESMAPTLNPGDFVLALKRSRALSRGDVIVFRQNGEFLVKRLVGLPGEVVELRKGRLFVDGKERSEPYADADPNDDFKLVRIGDRTIPVLALSPTIANWRTDVAPEYAIGWSEKEQRFLPLDRLTDEDRERMNLLCRGAPAPVPAGMLLVLGDNRQHSTDSRTWGAVPRDGVVAKVGWVFFPFGRASRVTP